MVPRGARPWEIIVYTKLLFTQAQVLLEAKQAALQARHLAGQMVVLQEHHKMILEQHRAHHAAALQRAKEEGQASSV